MAVSTSLDMVNMGGNGGGGGSVTGVAFEVEVSEWNNNSNASPQSVPKRIRRRLMEAAENKPSTLQEIQAKLKEADLRRQQFHEWLANKARSKPKSPTRPSNPEDLAQRLEAKLTAAEQKRLELLAQAQLRLAKSDELRQAAKTEVQLRAEREREELESKVESRVQQAETNRMALLEAERQRRAAAQERMVNSQLQRMLQEDKDKERMETLHATICQRVAAAEEKRLGLLEAEKTRAHLLVMQARKVANSVSLQREMEMRKRKEKLENRLQRAKRKRAELLRQRGRFGATSHMHRHKMYKHGESLSRKLARVWRQFQRSRRTTYTLTQEYSACEINHSTVNSLPFEQLAARIQSSSTLQSVTALLARVERWFMVSQHSQSNIANIDHLLKRISLGNKRTSLNSNRVAKKAASQVSVKATSRGQNEKAEGKERLRYPARVFLCAYMILGHPEAVFSGRGEREIALAEAATRLVPEFESLMHIILDGPSCSPHSRPSSPNKEAHDWDSEAPQALSSQRPFAAQLAAFDAAWCSYLYQFVVWKIKDAQSLEEDLIRVACQLELSMLQKCKITSEGDEGDVSHDIKAIRRQVLEDQQLLRDRILRLSGSSGMARMGSALLDARAKFMEAKENGSPLLSPFSPVSFSPSLTSPDAQEGINGKPKKVARSLFKSSSKSENTSSTLPKSSTRLGDALEKKMANDNEIMVNDILHDRDRTFADTLCGMNKSSDEIQVQIKSTMENAFWDCVEESLTRNPPDYSWVAKLVKEVRDELLALVPECWKQEILESIDMDLFSQILESGSQDIEYLSKLLEYSLGVVLKLSIPANDNESKTIHEQLFNELSEIAVGGDKKTNCSFARALVKGLRFILERIQVLKKDISAARIRSLEPLVQGLAGVRYLQESFTTHYGPYSGATRMLPQTIQWLTSVRQTVEQQRSDYVAALIAFRNSQPSVPSTHGLGLPPVTSLRTGGRLNFGKELPTSADSSPGSSSGGSLVCSIHFMAATAIVNILIHATSNQHQQYYHYSNRNKNESCYKLTSSPNQVRKNIDVNFTFNGRTNANTHIQAKTTQTKQTQIVLHDIDRQMNKLSLEERLKEAMNFFNAINSKGFIVESDIYAHLLQACADMRALAEGKQIHAQIVVSGIKVNAFLGTKLLNMYAQCRSLVDAQLYFDTMPRRNVFSWNTMIGVCARDGLYEEAIELYHQMQVLGFEPDKFTYPSVLKACAGLGDLDQGREIHRYIDGSGFESDVFVGNALVDMYAKCGYIEDARQVFDKMPQRDSVSWNAMIAGYAQSSDHGGKALGFLREMMLAGVELGTVTILSVLRACSELAMLQWGKEVHCYAMRTGLESDMAVGNAIVGMYVRCGIIEMAHRVFDRMSRRSAIAWTTMIAGYIEDGQSDMALKLFRHMQATGVDADSVTISSILPACAHAGALKHGKEIHGYTIRSGLEANSFVESALIYMYAKCGFIKDARLVFDKISRGDVVTWNAMLAGYAMHQYGNDVFTLFGKMQEAGMTPNHITFTALLSACSHAGLLDEGWKYFNYMIQDCDIRPTAEHYACLVNLLGCAGCSDEAREFIKSMAVEPNASVLGALLAACRVHSKVKVGERTAERLFALEPENAGNYVLLSNIYAAADRWDDAAKARAMIKTKGLKKTTGCSWIEIEKQVHIFLLEIDQTQNRRKIMKC